MTALLNVLLGASVIVIGGALFIWLVNFYKSTLMDQDGANICCAALTLLFIFESIVIILLLRR